MWCGWTLGPVLYYGPLHMLNLLGIGIGTSNVLGFNKCSASIFSPNLNQNIFKRKNIEALGKLAKLMADAELFWFRWTTTHF